MKVVGRDPRSGLSAPSGRRPEAAAAGAGAPPSNTAPSDSNHVHLVGAGVDSLYVSVPGNLKPGPRSLLERMKEQARSPDPELRALAQYPSHDWIFDVSDKGARLFSYVLTDSRYRIELARPSATLPLAHVQVSSAALAAYGVSRCVTDLLSILEEFGEIQGPPVVSRADLFVDVTTSCDLTRLEDEQWLTRAHSKARYSEQGQRSGYVIGRGGDVSLRLYDKTLEIRSSGKEHAKRQWSQRGWGGDSTVWRVETQLRRSVLHQFGVRFVDELNSRVGELWRYVVEQWCRLVVPNPEDRTASRWPTHPFWTAITGVPDFHTTTPTGRRSLQRSRAPADWLMARAFLSDLTSFMAAYQIFDTAWALEDLAQMTEVTFRYREEEGGVPLARYIAQLVALKTRAYGTGASFRVPQAIALEIRSRPRQRRLDDGDQD